MIILTQKEFDLLNDIGGYVPTEDKPFKVVSVNNSALKKLVDQGLVESRPKNALMLEVAITQLGVLVVNNEVEHEITTNETLQQEETTMEQPAQQTAETKQQPVQYVLEDNIPIPQVIARKPRENTMPLDVMQVGQSFLIPFKEDEDVHKGKKRISATVSQTKKRKFGANSTVQFVIAIVENGYRVWRKA